MRPLVAVLGAGGFIGARTVELLGAEGAYEVRSVLRPPPAAGTQPASAKTAFAKPERFADALDEAALEGALSGCRFVVHAIAGDPAVIEGAIAPLYRAAARAGVRRIVYLSSASVHGQAPAPGTSEASPLGDRQPIAYNNAKVRAERALLALRREGPVEVVILRPGIVHGPNSRWIRDFAADLVAGRAVLLNGGTGICNAVHVDNVVEAIRLSLTAEAADGRAYILMDRETVTWADLLVPVAERLALPFATARATAPWFPALHRILRRGRGWLQPLRRRLPKRLRDGFDRHLLADDAAFERRLLQTNRTRLSAARAEAELGYRAALGFPEAMERTLRRLDAADAAPRTPEAASDPSPQIRTRMSP